MEGNLLKEISYLTRLIEQHKKGCHNNGLFAIQENKKVIYSSPTANTVGRQNLGDYNYVKPLSVLPRRVHLNPNFKPNVPVIHVNPRIGTKASVHVNPRIGAKASVHVNPRIGAKDAVHVNPRIGAKASVHVNPRIGAKASVHVNPKMMKNFSAHSDQQLSDFELYKQNYSGVVRRKIEPSVHVNPKLMKELSSAKEKPENSEKFVRNSKAVLKPTKSDNNRLIVQSRTKIVKNTASSSNLIQKKLGSSSLVSLSQRKLVRIRRSSKTGSTVSLGNSTRLGRLSHSNTRKTKLSTKYKLVMEHVDTSYNVNTVPQSPKNHQGRLNKYKIDRTCIQQVKRRLSIGKNSPNNPSINKNASGSTTGLVRIGGILYKSSRNQLVRSSNDQQPSKRKRCIINVKGDRFVMASDSTKLRRLNSAGNRLTKVKSYNLVSRVDIGGMTFVEKTPNVLVRAHTKNSISTKAKQRSIQILRNKMRKNNQPCLIFQKLGYCTGQVKGTCPKLHDQKQVALCRNFLQGKCLLDNCPMSHSVCPEKMPTCKYFLEGCCIRDPCPYLHVKVSSSTPICTEFLRGYCAEANKCKQRHVYVCPEFEKSESCMKGKYCPYPHKPSSFDFKKSYKILKKEVVANREEKSSKLETVSTTPISYPEDRKRYYDEAGGSKKNLQKKKEKILNSIAIIKGVKLAEISVVDRELLETSVGDKTTVVKSFENSDQSDEEDTWPKRTPLGSLPAYIPIN